MLQWPRVRWLKRLLTDGLTTERFFVPSRTASAGRHAAVAMASRVEDVYTIGENVRPTEKLL